MHTGYVGACHAGAAIEGLCFTEGPADSSDNYNQFWFDYGGYSPDTGEVFQPGWLSWLLPYQDGDGNTLNQTSPLQFTPVWGSNVVAGYFQPSETYTYVSFGDDDKKLSMYGGYDDSSFNETRPEPVPTLGDLYNWHLCYQYLNGYYYQSVAWVLTDPPHNPSCAPVNLTLVEA